jgi:hypothetical protein
VIANAIQPAAVIQTTSRHDAGYIDAPRSDDRPNDQAWTALVHRSRPRTLERSTAIADDALTDARAALYGGAGRKP